MGSKKAPPMGMGSGQQLISSIISPSHCGHRAMAILLRSAMSPWSIASGCDKCRSRSRDFVRRSWWLRSEIPCGNRGEFPAFFLSFGSSAPGPGVTTPWLTGPMELRGSRTWARLLDRVGSVLLCDRDVDHRPRAPSGPASSSAWPRPWPTSTRAGVGAPTGPRAPRPGSTPPVMCPERGPGPAAPGPGPALAAPGRRGLVGRRHRGGPGRRLGQAAAPGDRHAAASPATRPSWSSPPGHEVRRLSLGPGLLGASWPTPTGPTSPTWSARARRDVYLTKSLDGMYLGAMRFDPVSGAIVAKELVRLEEELFEADWAKAKERLGRDPKRRRAGPHPGPAPGRRHGGDGHALGLGPGRRPAPEPLFTRARRLRDALRAHLPARAGPRRSPPGRCCPGWTGPASSASSSARTNGPSARSRPAFFTGATRRAIEVRDLRCQHEFCEDPVERVPDRPHRALQPGGRDQAGERAGPVRLPQPGP